MRRLLCLLPTLTLCLFGGVWVGGRLRHEPVPAAPQSLMSAPAEPEQTKREQKETSAGSAEDTAVTFAKQPVESQTEVVQKLMAERDNINAPLVGRLIRSMPPGDARQRSLEALLSHWVNADALEALEYMESLPPAWLNDPVLMHRIGFGLCQLPAERVIAFANTKLSHRGCGHLRASLASMLEQVGSFENTMAMLEGIHAEPDRTTLTDSIIARSFAVVQPEQVLQWIETETNPTRRDQTLAGYTSALEKQNPQEALVATASIVDSMTRRRQQWRHLYYWLTSDRAAALAWLRGAPADSIDAETRSYYLRQYEP